MRLATESDKGVKPPSLETTYHPYDFKADDPAWKELKARRILAGVKCLEMSHPAEAPRPECRVRLETRHVFDNQWNATFDADHPGAARLFDWILYCGPLNRKAKRGHYLDVTDEMQDLRRRTYACGFCGEEYYDPPNRDCGLFCGKCLGSEYLGSGNLHLLKLRPVADGDTGRADLTADESAFLLPIYLDRQLATRPETEAAQRDRIRLTHEKALRIANVERSGFEWLLDRGLDTRNVMFFGGLVSPPRFEFGWRGGYDETVTEELKRRLKDFPYPHEVKRA